MRDKLLFKIKLKTDGMINNKIKAGVALILK